MNFDYGYAAYTNLGGITPNFPYCENMKLLFPLIVVAVVVSARRLPGRQISCRKLPQSQAKTSVVAETTYIQLKPDWDWQGFNKPQAIIVGNEPFIY